MYTNKFEKNWAPSAPHCNLWTSGLLFIEKVCLSIYQVLNNLRDIRTKTNVHLNLENKERERNEFKRECSLWCCINLIYVVASTCSLDLVSGIFLGGPL